MPKYDTRRERSSQSSSLTPKTAMTSAKSMPVDFVQMVSEVPTGTKVSVSPNVVRLTRGSPTNVIRRATVLASHVFNLPAIDGLITTASIYKSLKLQADNYQRTHQDAFFEAYPGMLMLDKDDQSRTISTSYLRVNYKKFCKRVAHYIYHYCMGVIYLNGSLANLLSASRLKGNTLFNDIGFKTRWSIINSNTTMFERFPVLKGIQEYVFSNIAYGYGATSYGAEIVSLGLYATDIFGNRGCHCLPIDNLVTTKGGNGSDIAALDFTKSSVKDGEAHDADLLIRNIASAIDEYGNLIDTDEQHLKGGVPVMPKILNATTMHYLSKDGNINLAVDTAADDLSSLVMGENIEQGYQDDLTTPLWQTYKFWQKYMINSFPEMMDPNSDFRTYFTQVMPILEISKKREDLLNVVRNLKNFDMVSMLDRMKYKKGNRATRATIVRYAPLVGATSNSSRSTNDGDGKFKTNFSLNFERYDVDNDNTVELLAQSKRWPAISPTVFGNAANYSDAKLSSGDEVPLVPFVINSIPTIGQEIFGDQSQSQQGDRSMVVHPVGKFATLFDLVCTRSLDPETSQINMLGIDQDFAKSFCDGCDAISFEEDPSTVRTFGVPLIDNTDPFQCGFNIIINSDNNDPSEFDKYYTNKEYFPSVDEDVPEVEVNGTKVKAAPALDLGTSSSPKYVRLHTANPGIVDKLKHCMVFIGQGIFNHPLMCLSKLSSGNPFYQINLDDTNSKQQSKDSDPRFPLTGLVEALKPKGTDDPDLYTSINNTLLAAMGLGSDMGDLEKDAGINMLAHIGNGNLGTIIYSTFNPAFGPVSIATVEDDDGVAVASIQSIFKESIAGPTNDKLSIALTENAKLENMSDHSVTYSKQIIHDSVEYPAQHWMPFLAFFKFRPASVSSDSPLINMVGSEACGEIRQQNAGMYIRSLMSNILIQYTGIEDTKPFWGHDIVTKGIDVVFDDQINTTSMMPKANVMVEPRVPSSSSRGRANTFVSKNNSRSHIESQADNVLNNVGLQNNSNDFKDYDKKNKRHHTMKRHSNKNYHHNSDKEIADQDMQIGISPTTNSGFGKGISDKDDNDRFRKESSKDPTASSLMQ